MKTVKMWMEFRMKPGMFNKQKLNKTKAEYLNDFRGEVL